jgi:hypothetical protein
VERRPQIAGGVTTLRDVGTDHEFLELEEKADAGAGVVAAPVAERLHR